MHRMDATDIGNYIDHNWRMEKDRNKRLVPSERYRQDAHSICKWFVEFLSGSLSSGGLNTFFFFSFVFHRKCFVDKQILYVWLPKYVGRLLNILYITSLNFKWFWGAEKKSMNKNGDMKIGFSDISQNLYGSPGRQNVQESEQKRVKERWFCCLCEENDCIFGMECMYGITPVVCRPTSPTAH